MNERDRSVLLHIAEEAVMIEQMPVLKNDVETMLHDI
jgi:hypothetical protein